MQHEPHQFRATSIVQTIKIFFTDAQPWKGPSTAFFASSTLGRHIRLHGISSINLLLVA